MRDAGMEGTAWKTQNNIKSKRGFWVQPKRDWERKPKAWGVFKGSS